MDDNIGDIKPKEKITIEVDELPIELQQPPIYERDLPKGPPTYSLNDDPAKPVCLYYRLNKWRIKEILLMDNRYYHLIGTAVYTTDGKNFMGCYQPDSCYEIDDMVVNPDVMCLFCCPCIPRRFTGV